MLLKFIYPRGYTCTDADRHKENLCDKICMLMRDHLTLPKEIVIEMSMMSPSVYAETYLHYKNTHRIRLNDQLLVNDLVIPLVHELIHLEQLTLGKLMINHEGLYIWDNLSYNIKLNDLHYGDYLQLPWELDVHNRLPKLLKTAFNF